MPLPPRTKPPSTPEFVDKSLWGAGPWQEEPDRVEWLYGPYSCLIVRNREGGHLCGYVILPSDHPLFGKHTRQLSIEVRISGHGGINYADFASSLVGEGHPLARGWMLGFDCAHGFDYCPGFVSMFKLLAPAAAQVFSDGNYRDITYVQRCCEEVADTLVTFEQH